MTNEEAGAAISAALDTIETNANDAVDAVSGLDEAFTTISGMDGVSVLETIATKAELETIVADFRAKIYRWHSDAYKRAVELSIDSIFPQPRGSGGR